MTSVSRISVSAKSQDKATALTAAKRRLLGAFFSYGQVLPTYRYRHSPLGGPFQQSVADAIRLLSSNSPYLVSTPEPNQQADGASTTANYKAFMRPATAPSLSTIGSNWVHVFPEGCVHQDAQLRMRYFKWGVARLILEPEPAPDLLPIFIDGTQHIMAENRSWPRFLPRIGAKVKVAFGPPVDGSRFDDVRARWRDLVSRSRESRQRSKDGEGGEHDVDDLPDDLKYGEAASQIRIEVAKQVRDEVLRLRRSLGYLEEAAGRELARSWKESAEMIRPG